MCDRANMFDDVPMSIAVGRWLATCNLTIRESHDELISMLHILDVQRRHMTCLSLRITSA